jgi:outer membrane lipoprotein-sorting protein
MKKFIPFIAVMLLLPLPATTIAVDLSAREIMEKVDARDDGDNQISDMQMVLFDKNGNQRIRSIRSYTKDKGEDKYRIMFFLSPADVKNTAFLTYDYDDPSKDDDQWLYLPALRKSKRIASSDKSGSFMGSDFNYSDMTRKDLDNYDYQLLKEMDVNGQKVWLIESKPRTKEEMEETGYEKSMLFVRQDNFMVIRGIHWEYKGSRLKYMDAPVVEQIDGIWVARKLTMTTKKGKQTLHRTELNFDHVKFNQDLDESMFTIRRIEKGL